MTTLGGLQSWLQPYARWLVNSAPYAGARTVRVTSVVRSRAEQTELWNRRAKNPYPVAPPGSSRHELGLAFDIVTEPYDVLWTLGAWWKSIGGEWFASDPIHFQGPLPPEGPREKKVRYRSKYYNEATGRFTPPEGPRKKVVRYRSTRFRVK